MTAEGCESRLWSPSPRPIHHWDQEAGVAYCCDRIVVQVKRTSWSVARWVELSTVAPMAFPGSKEQIRIRLAGEQTENSSRLSGTAEVLREQR